MKPATAKMTNVEEKYIYQTAENSITAKDWAAGPRGVMESIEIIFSDLSAGFSKKSFSPAWYKCIDEAIVNALDQCARQTRTRNITISFSSSGEISVHNDGPGVEVQIHKESSKILCRPIYVPELIFGILFQGSNTVKSGSSTTGGTNGLGIKIANCFSSSFFLQTVDECSNEKYTQKWEKNMTVVHPPVISPRGKEPPGTLIRFIPDWSKFLYRAGSPSTEELKDLQSLIYSRSVFASIYAARFGATVHWNDEPITVRTASDFCSALFQNIITSARIPNTKDSFTWEIVLSLRGEVKSPSCSTSIINGIVVPEGDHLKHIKKQIAAGCATKLQKSFGDGVTISADSICKKIFFFVVGEIPAESLNWTGQRKDHCKVHPDALKKYIVGPKIISAVCTAVESLFAEKAVAAQNKKGPKIKYDKYIAARQCGGSKGKDCTLIAVEGDSAMSRVRDGISRSLSFDRYGVISLGGVIINARRQCTPVQTLCGTLYKKSKKLEQNEFVKALIQICGLSYGARYEDTAEGAAEKRSLRYGRIVMCVDQDHDGKGHILGLFLNLFDLFWPALLKSGYVSWFSTPLIRGYPKTGGKILQWYSYEEYDRWIDKNAAGIEGRYNIYYYKGLGSHSDVESREMFSGFGKRVFQFYTDDQTSAMFEIYFGDDSSKRKEVLSRATLQLSPDVELSQSREQRILCNDHLQTEVNLAQKSDLKQKLPHIIDGQNEAGRKIIDGCIKVFGRSGSAKIVAALGGEIKSRECYQHGEDSLNHSIIGRAIVTVGGRQLPFLVPMSAFGSRQGDDNASPRYLKTKLNYKLTSVIFPRADRFGLKPVLEEGIPVEPEWFYPILPLSILEHCKMPATGWDIEIWARDVFDVMQNVHRMIRFGVNCELLPMRPCTYRDSAYQWNGKIKKYAGAVWSIGTAVLIDSTVTITELPLLRWTTKYVQSLIAREDPMLLDIRNESDNDIVRIVIRVAEGFTEHILGRGNTVCSDIEAYFCLCEKMNSRLNLISADGGVLENQSYEDAIRGWFPFRRDMYIARHNREKIMRELIWMYYTEICRHIRTSENGSGKKIAEQEKYLADRGYKRINKTLLFNTGATPTADLVHEIIDGPKATYCYLLDLTDRAKSEESLVGYQAEIEKHLPIVAPDEYFPGAADWIEELGQCKKIIIEGQKSRWTYEDQNKFKY